MLRLSYKERMCGLYRAIYGAGTTDSPFRQYSRVNHKARQGEAIVS